MWQQEKFLCQFDGIPAYMEQAWSYGASALDVALYDRVDVVRGATGLLTGSGNPSASINLVRKHAVSRDLTGPVSVGGGDFNKTRSVADVTVPLRPEGTARARVVGVYRDGESDMERYSLRKKIGSAIVDANLTDSTLLSVGYEYQKKESNDVTRGRFPLFYSDGTRTDYKRSFNPAADWTFWDTRLQRTQAEGRLSGRTFLAGRSADAAGGRAIPIGRSMVATSTRPRDCCRSPTTRKKSRHTPVWSTTSTMCGRSMSATPRSSTRRPCAMPMAPIWIR
ncbi:outer membrane receptor for ferric iron uptake [Xanthomonas oryzae pv. oryzicola]|nr:outer membrane receptor for ferric iron uptake [Xanthomonas oryzae pv. oryzicola]